MTLKLPIQFEFKQTDCSSAFIYANNQIIAEIRNLQLCNVRFQPDGPVLIGNTVPMPLFWRQYANHQDPERSVGANANLILSEKTNNSIAFACTSTNQSGSAISRYDIELSFSEKLFSFVFHIHAQLVIPEGKQWLVTPNMTHGEVEFCNFWPEGSFIKKPLIRKQYQACYVHFGDRIDRIPHHHLETSDKQHIPLKKNHRFIWLLEDVNPVVEMMSTQTVHAGVCAYMWDAHFGYLVCQNQQEQMIEGRTEFTADFRIYTIDRKAGSMLSYSGQNIIVPETDKIPIYVNGVNSFSERLADFSDNIDQVWPWIFETENNVSGQVLGTVDRSHGYDDLCSLKIEHERSVTSQWMVTTLGPAYGQPLFCDGVRLKLSAFVCTEDVSGAADIAIRVHRTGRGSIFQLSDYEVFPAHQSLQGSNAWQFLEINTPPISPPPDRVHLLLRQSGRGKSWFDHVLFF